MQDRDRRLAKMELQLEARRPLTPTNTPHIPSACEGVETCRGTDVRLTVLLPPPAQVFEKEAAESKVAMRRAVGELELTKAELARSSLSIHCAVSLPRSSLSGCLIIQMNGI